MYFNIGPQTAVNQPIILPRYPTVAYNAPVMRPSPPALAGPQLTCLGCGGASPQLYGTFDAMPTYVKVLGVLALAGGGYYAYRRYGKRRRRR